MIDLSKTFDRVYFNILISMLKDTQVYLWITELISCILKKSFVNVFFNGFNVGQWPIGNEARQGGILSPLLFIFYLIDAIEF